MFIFSLCQNPFVQLTEITEIYTLFHFHLIIITVREYKDNPVDELLKVVIYAIMGLFRSLLFKRNEQPRGNEGRQHYVKG